MTDRILELDIQIERARFHATEYLIKAHSETIYDNRKYRKTGYTCGDIACHDFKCRYCYRPFSDDEMRKDAMDTAERHLDHILACLETRSKLSKKQ